MNEQLQKVIDLIPFIKEMTNVDAAICVWNKDAVAEAFFPSKEVPGIYVEIGQHIEDPNDPLVIAIRDGVSSQNKVPKEVFGIAFEGTITPVKENGQVVGAITYCYSTEEKDEIVRNTDQLTKSIFETDSSISGIMNGTKELANYMNQVQSITEMVRTQLIDATKVVDSIQKNAKYSNILALNASIESARAGQAGKGFAVVSDEMRKFSKMSSDAASQINITLGEIEKSLDDVVNNVNKSTKIAEQQASAATNLNDLFDDISSKAHIVHEICNKNMKL